MINSGTFFGGFIGSAINYVSNGKVSGGEAIKGGFSAVLRNIPLVTIGHTGVYMTRAAPDDQELTFYVNIDVGKSSMRCFSKLLLICECVHYGSTCPH